MRLFGLFGPRYCRSCGSRYERRAYFDGYSRRTGKPVVRHWNVCPKSTDREPDWYASDDCRPPMLPLQDGE